MTTEPIGAGLKVSGVAKTYNGVCVLQPLDLEVSPGEVHALLGENGSGKSTLIKILAGVVIPDHDGNPEVVVAGDLLQFDSAVSSYQRGLRFVHQDLGLVADLSVGDNMLLNSGFPSRFGTIREAEARREVAADLVRVGLDIDPRTLVSKLTPATRTGVAVARALRSDPSSVARVMVFDEPTATLPDNEVERLLSIIRAIAARGLSVIYITHRLDEVFQIAENVTVLRDGFKVVTSPVHAINRKQLVHLLVGDEFERLEPEKAPRPPDDAVIALSVDSLSAPPIRDCSLTVRAGEVVGIAGVTGSGSETALSAIFGRVARIAGQVQVRGVSIPKSRPDIAIDNGVAYLPAERKLVGGVMEYPAAENLTITNLRPVTRRTVVRKKLELAEAKTWFTRLAVRPRAVQSPLITFSGGNQQKILFGKWLRRRPAVFLLDEPTQGVDVAAKALLHRELHRDVQSGMAILVCSSDVDELVSLCHRVLVFRNGRIAEELRGSDVTASRITRACVTSEEELV